MTLLKTILRWARTSLQELVGSYNYQKFIVITRPRTGSNLLLSLLNSHPQIEAHGELFGKRKVKTCKETWDECFSKKFNRTRFAGFKIFYSHPRDIHDQAVWDFLEQDKAIRIIHLKRANVLRAYISFRIAGATKLWQSTVNRDEHLPARDKMIEVNIQHCLRKLRLTKEREKRAEARFSQHPYLELEYEDLARNPQNTMNAVFDFLSLPNCSVESKLRKQNPERISDLVSNYEALKAALTEAGYAEFLEE